MCLKYRMETVNCPFFPGRLPPLNDTMEMDCYSVQFSIVYSLKQTTIALLCTRLPIIPKNTNLHNTVPISSLRSPLFYAMQGRPSVAYVALSYTTLCTITLPCITPNNPFPAHDCITLKSFTNTPLHKSVMQKT